MKFTDWFNSKLKVGRYPTPQEIIESKPNYVINVSCEFIASNQTVCMDNGIRYFWFPMDEFSSDIGLNSLFGALQILWIAEMSNKSVILHCHAGANRSPTVMEAYYFMRTKKHLILEDSKENIELFKQIFPNHDPDKWKNNRLIDNVNNGYLPALNKMEKFLKQCEKWFLKQDWENDFITESGLNKIKHDCKL